MAKDHPPHPLSPIMESLLPEDERCFPEKRDYVTRETFSMYEELMVLIRFALPLGISHASGQLYDITDQVILGRLGTTYLAAAACGFIWTSLIDSVLFATIEQLSTVCAQAWGAGNNPLVGEWFQLWLMASLILGFPAVVARWYTGDVLLFVFGLDIELSSLAGRYALIRQYSIPFDIVYLCTKAYLSAQGIVRPFMIVELIFVIINACVAYSFVFLLGWGFIGAAIASTIVTASRTVIFLFYAFSIKKYHKFTWFGWTTESINTSSRWKTYWHMCTNSIGVLAEGIVWQVMSIMAASLGKAALAAHDLCLSILGLLAVFGSGLGAAIGVRLGAALGNNNVKSAKRTYRVGVSLTFGIGVVLAGIEILFGDNFASMASNDSEVLVQMASLKPYVATVIGLQLIWWPIYEVLLKQGRAATAGVITAVCGLVCMLPASYLCSQVFDLGIQGIWIGILAGYSVAMAIEFWMIYTSDWNKLATLARIRNEIEQEEKLHSIADEGEHHVA